MQTDREFASEGLELINFLNSKDETDEQTKKSHTEIIETE